MRRRYVDYLCRQELWSGFGLLRNVVESIRLATICRRLPTRRLVVSYHPLSGALRADNIRRKSLYKSLSPHAREHYPAGAIGIFPYDSDASIAILTVSSKYSPSNFWNGRWRSSYSLSPSSGTLTGLIQVDVHYYEDGNVRLITSKKLDLKVGSDPSAAEVVKAIAVAERKYQEELNRGFAGLSEGAFKGLRRQLPVTRQKVEWEKVGSYRVGYAPSMAIYSIV